MRKKFEKKLEIKKKAVPLQSRSERGARQRLRGAGKTERESSLKRLEEDKRKYRKKYERLFRPGDRTGDNRTGATGKIRIVIYKEEFDPGSG